MELLKLCPLCGEKVVMFTEKSPDGTITWGRIMHPATVPCGISFIDDKSEVVEKWNTRKE